MAVEGRSAALRLASRRLSRLFSILALAMLWWCLYLNSPEGVLLVSATKHIDPSGESYDAQVTVVNLGFTRKFLHIHPHETCSMEDVPDTTLVPMLPTTISRHSMRTNHSNPLSLLIELPDGRKILKVLNL